MIRWYDWVVALIAADFMTGFLFKGFSALTWWEPIVYGILLGGIWNLWKDHYCKYRLIQEYKNKY